MNLSPKQRFQKNADLSRAHLEWCAKDTTHAILEAALAQYVESQPAAPNQMLAVDYHQRLAGAKAFIDELLNLSEPPSERRTRPSDNLPLHRDTRDAPKIKE